MRTHRASKMRGEWVSAQRGISVVDIGNLAQHIREEEGNVMVVFLNIKSAHGRCRVLQLELPESRCRSPHKLG